MSYSAFRFDVARDGYGSISFTEIIDHEITDDTFYEDLRKIMVISTVIQDQQRAVFFSLDKNLLQSFQMGMKITTELEKDWDNFFKINQRFTVTEVDDEVTKEQKIQFPNIIKEAEDEC